MSHGTQQKIKYRLPTKLNIKWKIIYLRRHKLKVILCMLSLLLMKITPFIHENYTFRLNPFRN